MKNIKERLEDREWNPILDELHKKGFATVKNLLDKKECDELIKAYNNNDIYRKTISMERYRFGSGEYKYFQYPLPDLITNIRATVYSKIVSVANSWMMELNIDKQFPPTHAEMKKLCHDHGQTKPTILILKYGEGG